MSSRQSIAERAYHLWIERGRPHGSQERDWLEAERQLAPASPENRDGAVPEAALDTSLKETFPASDPASSHLPDVPPSNADEKWKAAGKGPRKDARSSSEATAANVTGKADAGKKAANPPR
jgi:hypothetical protein